MSEATEVPRVLPEGVYNARIVNYGVAKSQKGDGMPAVCFAAEFAGRTYNVWWKGSFNGGARDNTIKALIIMGLREASKMSSLADGIPSNLLDMSRDYSIDVINDVTQGDNPKPYAKVNWVNEAGGTVRDAISKAEATQLFAGLNLGGAFQEQLKKLGIDSTKKAPAPAAPAAPTGDKIPF